MTAALDTNVLVYLFDDAAPAKQVLAAALLQRLPASTVVPAQALAEAARVLTAKRTPALAPTQTQAFVSDVAALFVEVPLTSGVVANALALQAAAPLSYFDAQMLAAAAQGGASVLLTEDLQDGQTYGTVKAVNPFAPAFDLAAWT